MGLQCVYVTVAAMLIGIGCKATPEGMESIRRNHTCDFETISDCGWIVDSLVPGQGVTGITPANDPPNLGPRIDANPGNENGHYFYFSSQTLSRSLRILHFPSHSLVCGLSFSYYLLGPLDLGIIRQNLAFHSVYMSQSFNTTNTSMWARESFSFNTSKSYDGELSFEVSLFDVGEAIEEPGMFDLLLGLDDILLMFCLPCDYDQLGVEGGLVLNGPNEINVRLRFTSQIAYNGTSPVCPNEQLVFTIDSVEPRNAAAIFSLDPLSGVLTITANGPGLEPTGVEMGHIQVSVYILGSNYTHTSSPPKQSLMLTFHQPPTITHTVPHTIPVHIETTFTYQFSAHSALGQNLNYGKLSTNPDELFSDLSMTITDGDVTVSGIISLNRVLPLILEQQIVPSISVPISDEIGGVVNATTQLVIQQAPPIFNQTHYEFNVLEETGSGAIFGPIPVLDPNGDPFSAPVITTERESRLFAVIFRSSSSSYKNYDILSLQNFDYEVITTHDFDMVVYDTVNTSLSSQATVRVNVLPSNEFPPVFQQSSYSTEISDVDPIGSFVAEFEATDRDSGSDGEITYSITGGNDDGFFGITGVGFGEVIVQTSPILPHSYNLVVTATDRGNPPISADATLTIRVLTTSMIDCTQPEYDRPVITSPSVTLQYPAGTDISLDCEHSADPIERSYKWTLMGEVIFPKDSSGHFIVSPSMLTVHNLTAADAGLYNCNVTNQCGSTTIAYYLEIIDYPKPPLNPQVTAEPDTDSLRLVWDPPSNDNPHPNAAVSRPLSGYEVWVRDEEDSDYQTIATVGPSITEVNVTGLHPGTFYWVVVASVNEAGSTPSVAINVTTVSSVPKLSFLRATEQSNDSILIEWELGYDGGFPIISFELHVILQTARSKRDTPTNPDLIYHTSVDSGHLVTRSVQSGRSYVVRATVYNEVGSSDEFAYLYVGHKDNLVCDFENSDSTSCHWQLEMGVVTIAESAPPLLLNMDSQGNPLGHFIAAQTNQSSQEIVMMSYTKAWYGCGYSFSYQLSEGAELSLRTTSGEVVWSSSVATSGWREVRTEGDQFVTGGQNEGLEFVLQGSNAAAVVDEVNLNFCLPCDFALLDDNNGFHLSYPNYTKLYLRTEQTLSLTADLQGCDSAALDFNTVRVVPSELEGSFSLSVESPRSLSIFVSPIPSDRVLPHTAGFIEVVASIVHSDYRPDGMVIQRTAFIEFILLQSSDNCSFAQSCGFESGDDGCGLWEVGSGVQLVTGSQSPVKELNSNSGTFLYGDYSVTTLPSSTVTSSRIADTYCAVSFSYSTPPTLELVVSVGGLGQIWSSILATTTSSSTPWLPELVPIDLESVSLSDDRELMFIASQAEGYGEAGLDTPLPVYVALDNITLHPCIDCNTPECSFSSCIPGHYFSLAEESCITCPQGYYCPDWRGLPKPCPPGSYSEETNAASQSVCQVCQDDTYTLVPGSISCQTCPSGFNCLNASHFPLSGGNGQCSTTSPSVTSPPTVSMLTVIVSVAAGGVALLLCLLLSCVVGCWCYKSRKGSSKKKKNRERMLLSPRDDALSIGSAGSLGRSSVTTMSTFDGRGRKWKKGKDASTLMSFLTDDETDPAYCDETSWADTEELTKPEGRAGKQETVVFKNDGYNEGNDLQLVDVGNYGNQRSKNESRRLATGMSQF